METGITLIKNIREILKKHSGSFDFFILPAVCIYSLLSLINLSTRGIWLDEAFSIVLANESLEELIRITITDVHPPLYYFILKLWISLFGDSEFSVRFPSYIFGLLVVIFTYYLAKRYFSRNVAIFSSICLSMTPFFIEYAREARMYTLLPLLVLASVYLLFEYNEHPSFLKGIAYLFTLVCLLYTHNYGIFIFIPQMIFCFYQLIFEEEKNFKIVFSVLIIQLISAFLYLPWISILFDQLNVSSIGGAITEVSTSSLINTLMLFSFQERYFTLLGLAILSLSIVMIRVKAKTCHKGKIFFLRIEFDEKSDRNFILLLFFSLFFIGFPFFISWRMILGYSIYNHRYVLSALPLLSICTFYSVSSIYKKIANNLSFSIEEKRIIPRLIIVLILVLGFVAEPKFVSQITYEGHGYREAVELIRINQNENDIIIIEASYTYMPFNYYSSEVLNIPIYPITFNGNETISLISSFLIDNHNIWYVMAHSKDVEKIIVSWAEKNSYLVFADESRYVEVYYFSTRPELQVNMEK